MDQVNTRWSVPEVKDAIAKLIAGLAGRADQTRLVEAVKMRVGLEALNLISEAFRAKSQHGTGEDGIQWAELQPATIANRRLDSGDNDMLKDLGIRSHSGVLGKRSPTFDVLGRAKRAFLTEAQDKRWRMLFARKKAFLQGMHGMGEGESSAMAAANAWITLKSEGALTKLQVLGSRTVAIGVDTGRLLASLSPGIEDLEGRDLEAAIPAPVMVEKSQEGDRILRTEPGAIIVGTNVEYAHKFHEKRPLWASELPSAWSQALARVCGQAISRAIVIVMGEAA